MIYGPLRASLDEWLKLSPPGFSLEQLRAFNISRVFAANQKLATIKKIGELGLREQLVEISTLMDRNVSCLASIQSAPKKSNLAVPSSKAEPA
jgi:hypothetical protein